MFNSAIAAAAIGIDNRQFDNFIRRHCSGMVQKGQQGRSRSISYAVVERVALALVLVRDLGCRPAGALSLATRILATDDAELTLGSLTSLRFDRQRLRRVLDQTLADAVEATPPSPRGRPKGSGRAKKLRGASEETPRAGW